MAIEIWSVLAQNLPEHARNPIHTDAGGGRDAGARGHHRRSPPVELIAPVRGGVTVGGGQITRTGTMPPRRTLRVIAWHSPGSLLGAN